MTHLAHAATAAGHAAVVVVWAWQAGLVTTVRTRWRLLGLAVRVMLRALYRRYCRLTPAPARGTGPRSGGVGWQCLPSLLVPDESRPRGPPGQVWMVAAAAGCLPVRGTCCAATGGHHHHVSRPTGTESLRTVPLARS